MSSLGLNGTQGQHRSQNQDQTQASMMMPPSLGAERFQEAGHWLLLQKGSLKIVADNGKTRLNTLYTISAELVRRKTGQINVREYRIRCIKCKPAFIFLPKRKVRMR